MTDREKAIVMAHTGICMLTGDKFQIFHKYVEDLMGRPIMTHELALLADTIKEKSKVDFIELCKDGSDSIKTLQQEPCEDVVDRKALYEALYENFHDEDAPNNTAEVTLGSIRNFVKDFPSVTPKQRVGRWVYDKTIENWRCSECSETPKTIGYVGTTNFMAEHFRFCNHCGTKMQEVKA